MSRCGVEVLGLTLETVSRTFAALKHDGLLNDRAHRVSLLDRRPSTLMTEGGEPAVRLGNALSGRSPPSPPREWIRSGGRIPWIEQRLTTHASATTALRRRSLLHHRRNEHRRSANASEPSGLAAQDHGRDSPPAMRPHRRSRSLAVELRRGIVRSIAAPAPRLLGDEWRSRIAQRSAAKPLRRYRSWPRCCCRRHARRRRPQASCPKKVEGLRNRHQDYRASHLRASQAKSLVKRPVRKVMSRLSGSGCA